MTVVCTAEELRPGDVVGHERNLVISLEPSSREGRAVVVTVLTPRGVKRLPYFRDQLMCRSTRRGESDE